MKKICLFLLFLAPAILSHAQVVVSGDITTNTTWTKNNTYLLTGFVFVTDSATLTIEPGTVIKGDKASKGTLVITRGAKLIADGTPSEPIVFTSNEPDPAAGDWGGILLLGYAATNFSFNGSPGICVAEGFNPKALYGGGDLPGGPIENDNSGILRYVRIEYPGIAIQPNNELNGLTLAAVGSGTLIDFVEVYSSSDDSFEWFGGSVNCKHLVSFAALDDDFDADAGYRGHVQFALAVRNPGVADVSGSNGFETDNDPAGDWALPRTQPAFSNVTLIGPIGSGINTNYRRAAHIRRNSATCIANSLLMGQWPVGVSIDGDATAVNAQDGALTITNTLVSGAQAPLFSNATNGFAVQNWFFGQTGNGVFSDPNAPGLQAPFDDLSRNPLLRPNSIALNAAGFSAGCLNDPFFEPVTYLGAFDSTGDWTFGWMRSAPFLKIFGKDWIDAAGDCAYAPNKPAAAGWKVAAKKAGVISYNFCDATGNYEIPVLPGAYEVNLVPKNSFWQACQNDIPVSVSNSGPYTAGADLAATVSVFCPYLRVSIASMIFPWFFQHDNSHFVEYCNEGTAPADDVVLTLTLSPEFRIIGASQPWSDKNGQTLTFQLGTLEPGACGHLEVLTQMDSLPALGTQLCNSALLLPEASCTAGLPALNSALECYTYTGPFDPNDKMAFVSGQGRQDWVAPDSLIEYQIRFQNTGTDTAYRVVIEDRLAPGLDIGSVEPLVASHPYRVQLVDDNLLRFIFENILLPDSNANEPASHGLVKFRVAQRAGNPLGAVIDNFADIYFDLNAPVRTDTARLTIRDAQVSVYAPDLPGRLRVYPNPASTKIHFKDPGDTQWDRIELCDIAGRRLRELPTPVQNEINIDPLPAGVYFIRFCKSGRCITQKVNKM